MFYKKLEIKDLLDKNDSEKQVIDLLEEGEAYLKLIYIKKNGGFDSHTSHTNVCIYLLDGEIELSFPKEIVCSCNTCFCDTADEEKENAEKYVIKKSQLFMFEKEVKHTVKALKDSSFLLIKI